MPAQAGTAEESHLAGRAPCCGLYHQAVELAAAFGELVLDPHGAGAGDATLHDSAPLELLHALAQQAVGQVGPRVGDLAEPHRAA